MREKQRESLAQFFYKLAEYSFAGLVIGTIATSPKEVEMLLKGRKIMENINILFTGLAIFSLFSFALIVFLTKTKKL